MKPTKEITKHSIETLCCKKSQIEDIDLVLKQKEEQFEEAVARMKLLMIGLEASQRQVMKLTIDNEKNRQEVREEIKAKYKNKMEEKDKCIDMLVRNVKYFEQKFKDFQNKNHPEIKGLNENLTLAKTEIERLNSVNYFLTKKVESLETTIHAREHEITHSVMMVKSNSGVISNLNRKIKQLSQEKRELIEYQNTSTVSSQMNDKDRYSCDGMSRRNDSCKSLSTTGMIIDSCKSLSTTGTQYGDWIEDDWRNMVNKSDAEKAFTGSLGNNLAYCRNLVKQIKANLERNSEFGIGIPHVNDKMKGNGFGDIYPENGGRIEIVV